MRSRLLWSCYVVIIVSATLLTTSDATSLNKKFENVSKLIFGRLWKFNQYCADDRNYSSISEDDIKIELFYNGTLLKSLARSPNHSSLVNGLNELNHIGVRSRDSCVVMCSKNSWGYAEDSIFDLSNEPFDNETDCHLNVDKMYNSAKILIILRNSSNTAIETNSNVEAQSPESTLYHFLQLNTFGRMPAGQTFYNSFWPGDFKGCTSDPAMRYCFAAYRMKQWATTEPIDFRIGICLPRSCNSRLIDSIEYQDKLDALIRLNLINGIGLTSMLDYKMTDLHCPPAEDSHFRNPFRETMSKILIVAALAWMLMLVYSTLINFKGQLDRHPLMESFDLRKIWIKFKHSEHIAPDLIGINAVKVVTMNWLIIAHVCVISTSYFSNLNEYRDDWRKSPFAALFIQGQHSVPPFFIISGLLVGHKYLGKKFDASRLIIYRYIRLVPMYLVIYAYTKQFAHLIGSGPLWDYGVSEQSEARQCMNESWLVPLLMLANFIPPFAHCILTGWHIANDFQIYLTLPFLLYAYRRSRRLGTLVAVGGFIVSQLYHVWSFNMSGKFFPFRQFAFEPFVIASRVLVDRMSYTYVSIFSRIGTYFLGIILADLLITKRNQSESNYQQYCMKLLNKNKVDSVEVKDKNETDLVENEKKAQNSAEKVSQLNQTRFFHWTAKQRCFFIFITGLIFLSVAVYSPISHEYMKNMFGRYGSSLAYPYIWYSVDIAWFMLLYALLFWQTSDAGKSNKSVKTTSNCLLQSKVWNVLVKLNYCLILSHFIVARYIVQTQTQLLVYSWINFAQLTTFVILSSYLSSFLIHLTIEMPLTSIVNQLTTSLDPKFRKSKAKD